MDVADLLFIVITAAFVAVCVAYVRWCDRIVGPDEWSADALVVEEHEREEVAA